jgi:hypothetical protein
VLLDLSPVEPQRRIHQLRLLPEERPFPAHPLVHAVRKALMMCTPPLLVMAPLASRCSHGVLRDQVPRFSPRFGSRLLLRGRPDRRALATTPTWRSRQVPLAIPVSVHDEDVLMTVALADERDLFPSGDQRGCDPPCVSLRWPLPSAFMTYSL